MFLSIPDVLAAEQVAEARRSLDTAEWADGKVTAGYQSAKVKNNAQLPESHPVARQLGETIVAALGRHPLFLAAALPLRIFPPLFNRYSGGQSFGTHVDNAIRQVNGTPHRIRTDLSATLFLAAPEEYDGGELCIEEAGGIKHAKLPAGHMVLYPATTLHQVRPVTRGARVAAFFWIQSMVRDDTRRTLLLDLDIAIQRLRRELPGNNAAEQTSIQLTGVYHNLLRHWAEL
jgi:PKHD-type hydroxylase